MDLTVIIASVVLALTAAYTDIRWGKIFNVITVPFALLGLTLNTFAGGLEGLLLSLGGIGAGFALWFVSNFLGRILGGGDIKLLMAFGALMGPAFMLWTFGIGAVVGGVMAVAVALKQGLLGKVFRQMGTTIYMRAKFSEPMEITDGAGEIRLPYAIALGLGALITIGARMWSGGGV